MHTHYDALDARASTWSTSSTDDTARDHAHHGRAGRARRTRQCSAATSVLRAGPTCHAAPLCTHVCTAVPLYHTVSVRRCEALSSLLSPLTSLLRPECCPSLSTVPSKLYRTRVQVQDAGAYPTSHCTVWSISIRSTMRMPRHLHSSAAEGREPCMHMHAELSRSMHIITPPLRNPQG